MLLEFIQLKDGNLIMINSQSIHAIEDGFERDFGRDMPDKPCTRITYSSGAACFVVDTKEPMASIVDRVNFAIKSENRF